MVCKRLKIDTYFVFFKGQNYIEARGHVRKPSILDVRGGNERGIGGY